MHDNISDSVKVDARAVGVDLVTFTEIPDCFGLAWDVPTEEICQVCPARTECFTIFPRTIARVRKETGEDVGLEVLAKRLETSTQAVLLALGGSTGGSIDAMLEVVPPTKPAAKKKVRKKATKKAGKKTGKKKPPPAEKKDPPLSDQPEVLDNEGGGPVCQTCGGKGEQNDEPCPACTGVGHQEAGAAPLTEETAHPIQVRHDAEAGGCVAHVHTTAGVCENSECHWEAFAVAPPQGPPPTGAQTEEEPPAETAPLEPQTLRDHTKSAEGVVEFPRIAAAQVGRLKVLLERGFTLTEALTRAGFDVIDAG